jgi:hypothetical protein
MSTRTRDVQRKRRLAKRQRRHPIRSSWDHIKSIFKSDSALDVEMRAFVEARKAERRLERLEASRQRRRGNRPNWKQVAAFAALHFPGEANPSGWRSEEEMLRSIKSCWWSGEGSHGVGGNWWSRVVRPAWEREKGFRK